MYDPVGNRLVRDVDSELTTSTYDAANRLRTAEELSGITTYTYDADGNQRSVEVTVGPVSPDGNGEWQHYERAKGR